MSAETENLEKEKIIDEDAAAEEETPETAEDVAVEDKKSAKADKKKFKKMEAEIADLKKQLEAKNTELGEQSDRYLRVVAEYDNFRKRSAKEKEGIYADAYSDAVNALLPVLDNLERATAFSDAESVVKGVQMTLKGAVEAFGKMGVESFGEAGDLFDPNMHNAVMHIEDEALGEGVIVEVFQKGYKKGDRIFRYAMVKVAN